MPHPAYVQKNLMYTITKKKLNFMNQAPTEKCKRIVGIEQPEFNSRHHLLKGCSLFCC
jgi:hypothetical protein